MLLHAGGNGHVQGDADVNDLPCRGGQGVESERGTGTQCAQILMRKRLNWPQKTGLVAANHTHVTSNRRLK